MIIAWLQLVVTFIVGSTCNNVLRELVTLDAVDFLSFLEMIPIRTKCSRVKFQDVFEEARKRVFLLHGDDEDQKNRKRKTKHDAASNYTSFQCKNLLCVF